MTNRRHERRSMLLFGLAAGLLAGCSTMPKMEAAAIPSVPAGAARIWFYRENDPQSSLRMAAVLVDGDSPIYVKPDGSATFRDVAAGHHQLRLAGDAVGSALGPAIDLVPGQEVFIKITVLGGWNMASGADHIGGGAFQLVLIAPDAARQEIASHRFAGPG